MVVSLPFGKTEEETANNLQYLEEVIMYEGQDHRRNVYRDRYRYQRYSSTAKGIPSRLVNSRQIRHPLGL